MATVTNLETQPTLTAPGTRLAVATDVAAPAGAGSTKDDTVANTKTAIETALDSMVVMTGEIPYSLLTVDRIMQVNSARDLSMMLSAALEACWAWHIAEKKGLGSFDARMELCNYSEWATRRALTAIYGQKFNEPY